MCTSFSNTAVYKYDDIRDSILIFLLLICTHSCTEMAITQRMLCKSLSSILQLVELLERKTGERKML